MSDNDGAVAAEKAAEWNTYMAQMGTALADPTLSDEARADMRAEYERRVDEHYAQMPQTVEVYEGNPIAAGVYTFDKKAGWTFTPPTGSVHANTAPAVPAVSRSERRPREQRHGTRTRTSRGSPSDDPDPSPPPGRSPQPTRCEADSGDTSLQRVHQLALAEFTTPDEWLACADIFARKAWMLGFGRELAA